MLWRQNLPRVAGVDEAGRGPLAEAGRRRRRHPAIALGGGGLARRRLALADDSKQLTEAQREKYFEFLTACVEIEFAIAAVDMQA